MRITFFGTSHGYPEPNRKCSSALVEVCGKRILIDIGCNVAEELITRGMTLDSIDAIFPSILPLVLTLDKDLSHIGLFLQFSISFSKVSTSNFEISR